jgi:competence protein ComEC
VNKARGAAGAPRTTAYRTAGFAVATIKAALIAHPVLRYPADSVSLAGFVTLREESQKSDRS